MVVHDIRNPASSIDFGLSQTLQVLEGFEAQYNKMLKKMEEDQSDEKFSVIDEVEESKEV